jgi:hypothetical protein
MDYLNSNLPKDNLLGEQFTYFTNQIKKELN